MANHNWYIGQDIVCIKTHPEGLVKEGEIYTIKALCKCCNINIQVGVKSPTGLSYCIYCDKNFYPDTYQWFSEIRFAPLDTLTDISEIEEILNQPIEQLFKI